MKPKYCPRSSENSEKSNKTCEMLNTFKSTYESYLSSTQHINYKIPSLDKDEVEYLTMCTQDNSRSTLTREGYGTVPAATSLNGVRDGDTDGMSSYEGAMNYTADGFTPTTEANVEIHGSPMSSTVSTAVGTVAGASSVLALLYKFSPARRWVHSGILGNSGRMNSNLYGNEPNELLFDGFQGENMSSHNARYNIGYGSV
ncbi:Plasmodium vivax Vir protein, putative [Plasmodium vivax]|nr:Plasmodium vivax Vir protein, putative [Plasmodium vivax]